MGAFYAVFGKRPYSPMRNNKGGFDISICVTCVGGDFDYQDEHNRITKADVSILVALDNCSYSHEKGFVWNETTGTYRVLDFDITPSITLYKDDEILNSADIGCNYTKSLCKTNDKALSKTLIEDLLANSAHNEMIAVFMSVVNQNSTYKVKA